MIHLRDQHDRTAEQRDTGQYGGMGEDIELAAEEFVGRAVAGGDAPEDEGELGQFRQCIPIGCDKAHGGETEQDGAENGERAGRTGAGCAALQIAPDFGGALVGDVALAVPACNIGQQTRTCDEHC